MGRVTILTTVLLMMPLFGAVNMRLSASETSAVTGTVTFTTSRSVYVRLDQPVAIADGDTVDAGLSPAQFTSALVKSTGTGKVVLDRTVAFADVEVDQTVYFDANASSALPPAAQTPAADIPRDRFRVPDMPLDGRVAVQYYRYRAANEHIEYDQPSVYFDLGTGGNSSPLALSLRFRSRLQRTLDMPEGRDMTDERTDRLYDLAASYRTGRLMVTLGRTRRIGGAGMGGMGGLDGVAGEYRIHDTVTGGVFLGIAPQLDNFIGDRRETKNGAYLIWARDGDVSSETAIAFIHRSERDGPRTGTLYIGQQYSRKGTFRMNGEAVVVVSHGNTGEVETPEDTRLQNARASIGWTLARWLRVSVNYSGYLVREYRDLNGLFDPLDILRYEHTHTVRSRVDLTLPDSVTLSGEALAGENHDRKPGLLSGAIRGRIANVLDSGIAAGMSYVQTGQGVGVGRHVLVNVSRTVSGLQCSVSGGVSVYSRAHADDTMSERLQVSVFFQPGRRFYVSAQAIRNWDERINANTIFLEAGTKFGSSGR